eukprot:m.131841 g.131841  ORF g.131841 m.131841 type:complete len:1128 (+) comp15758_c0_seq3:128-3511(+)
MSTTSLVSSLRHGGDEEAMVLVEVISQLSKFGSAGERQAKRQQIESQLTKYNKQVADLVDEHHESFTQALHAFMELISNVDASKHKAAHIRSALTACKSLLNCHREHVRQLYLDSIEHKEMIRLYELIEEIQTVPAKIDEFIQTRHYVHAAGLIDSTRKRLEELRGIHAIHHLQEKLQQKTITLRATLLQELEDQLFVRDAKTREKFDDIDVETIGVECALAVERLDANPTENPATYLSFILQALAILRATREAGIAARSNIIPGLRLLIDKSIAHCHHTIIPSLPRSAIRQASVLRVSGQPGSANAMAAFLPTSTLDDSAARDEACAPYIMFHACKHLFVNLRRVLIAHLCMLRIASLQGEAGQISLEDGSHVAVESMNARKSTGDHPGLAHDLMEMQTEPENLGTPDSTETTGDHNPLEFARRRFTRPKPLDLSAGNSMEFHVKTVDGGDLWTSLQVELARLLSKYLDIGDEALDALLSHVTKGTSPPRDLIVATQAGSAAFQLEDVLARFGSKREREKLLAADVLTFSFANSDHAISSTMAHVERHLAADSGRAHGVQEADAYTQSEAKHRIQLCAPVINNILGAYKPVVLFTEELERLLGKPHSTSGIRLLLAEYVRHRYLAHLQEHVRHRVKNLAEATSVSSDSLQEVSPARVVIASTWEIWQIVGALCAVLHDLPHYAKDIVVIMEQALGRYFDFCRLRFGFLTKAKTQTSALRKTEQVLATEWLKNKDLVGYLRTTSAFKLVVDKAAHIDPTEDATLSPWASPRGTPGSQTPKSEDTDLDGTPRPISTSSSGLQTVFESDRDTDLDMFAPEDRDEYDIVTHSDFRSLPPQDVTVMSTLLGNNLLDKFDVVPEVSALKSIAHLCESLEWLGLQVSALTETLLLNPSNLKRMWQPGNHPIVEADGDYASSAIREQMSQQVINGMQKLAQSFIGLSQKCLLFLRVEIRCRCMLYLIPTLKLGNYFCDIEAVETDPQIVQFNRNFLAIDEAMSAVLRKTKREYLLEDLDAFVADLFIQGMRHIRRINEHGVKRMCRNIFAIQQTLTSVGKTRAAALDRAMQYYELLYVQPREVLQTIASKKVPPYSEQECLTLLKLMSAMAKVPNSAEYQGAIRDLHALFHDLV